MSPEQTQVGYGHSMARKRDPEHKEGAESASHRVTTRARRDLSGPWTRKPPKVKWPKYKPRTRAEVAVMCFFVAIPWIGVGVVVWLVLAK